ncbi:hypothetical protein [Paenibacillus dendritiformis]|uniref:hypothetical protein n=1 Tax=Paenibacillus dendritiformis TaxID=130049 RepID=UPI0005931894|nr:hypothetical protein [Paenibacillus dendritiformis]
MKKHPSRYLVIKSIETGEQFRIDIFNQSIPDGFRKVTHVIPCEEKYWGLPIYGQEGKQS